MLQRHHTHRSLLLHHFVVFVFEASQPVLVPLKVALTYQRIICNDAFKPDRSIPLNLPIMSTTRRVSKIGSITSSPRCISLLFCKFRVSRELRFSKLIPVSARMLAKETSTLEHSKSKFGEMPKQTRARNVR